MNIRIPILFAVCLPVVVAFSQEPSSVPSGHSPSAIRQEPPAIGLAIPCQIVEVYDGDTLTVRVQADLRVRLVDCWAPEIRTKDETEKVRGLAARDHLKTLAPVNSPAVLSIDLNEVDRLDDLLTLGRVLGKVSVDGKDLSTQQVAAGHAKEQK
jgi:endonuclease YncB( thermonuclease family)